MNSKAELRCDDIKEKSRISSVTVKAEKGSRTVVNIRLKTYVLYCVVTLSVVFLSLALAATEMFSVFFADWSGGGFLSRLFGNQADAEMSFGELLLSQSFIEYPRKNNNKDSNSSEYNKENVQAPPSDNEDCEDNEKEPSQEENKEENKEENDKQNSETDIYFYDPTGVPEGMCGIMPMDLSLKEYGLDYINNQSIFTPDMEVIDKISVSTDISSVYPVGSPLVLIVHTHGTEAFSDDGATYYDPSNELARSYDTDKNVVSLGRVMAEILCKKGIPAIHCDVMHDAESYGGAYARSADTVKSYLEKYPSIQYVIDVHRDAIVKSSGEIIRPVSITADGTSAQIMCVVGTGSPLKENHSWKNNLSLAQKLRKALNGEVGNICRPTCLRDSAYNQQYAAYSLLIEIGAAGNSYDEAFIAAKTAANALATVLRGK